MMKKLIITIGCLFFSTLSSLEAMSDQLYLAIDKGQVAVVQQLLNKDATLANAMMVRSEQLKAIHSAAMSGNVDIVAALLDKGADINAKDKMGMTPLHYAAQENHVDVIRLLLARGANKEVTSKLNETPISIAKATTNNAIIALLTGGTVVTSPTKPSIVVSTSTPLTPVSSPAVTTPAIADRPRASQSDLLQQAITVGNIMEIRNILSQDSSFANKKIKGMRRFPLNLAVATNQRDVVALLLASGANKNSVDNSGKTALDLAREKNYQEIINMLAPAPAVVTTPPTQVSIPVPAPVVAATTAQPQIPALNLPIVKKQVFDSLDNIKKFVSDIQTYNSKQKNQATLTQALGLVDQVKVSLLDLQANSVGK